MSQFNDFDFTLEEAEQPISINLKNQYNGVHIPDCDVFHANTFRQLIQEYASDLGIDIKSDYMIFTNKRNGESTSELDERIDKLGLSDGDTLVINDDGRNA